MPGKPRGSIISRDAARTFYLGLGRNRSLDRLVELADQMNMPTSRMTFARWSKQDGWVAAAEEFDRQLAPHTEGVSVLEAIADEIRHAQFGRAMQELAILGMQQKRADPASLSGSEIARLGEVGWKIERVTSGEVTERVDIVSGAMSVLVEQVGPEVQRLVRSIEEVTTGWPDEYRLPLVRAIQRGSAGFAIRMDEIIDATFRQHGLSVAEAIEGV